MMLQSLFSRPNRPWFVISRNLPMANTRADWLCFGAFPLLLPFSLRLHWPLATILSPLAAHHYPPPSARPAGSGRPQTLPRWLLLDTDDVLPKTERGPISTSDPSRFSMSPTQAIRADKSNRFYKFTARLPLTILS